MIPKPTRQKDEDFIAWLHGWGCIICNTSPIHAHHVQSIGAGGADKKAIPLCAFHHRQIHQIGSRTFAERHRINLEKKIEIFNGLYESGEPGPNKEQVLCFKNKKTHTE